MNRNAESAWASACPLAAGCALERSAQQPRRHTLMPSLQTLRIGAAD